MSVLSPTPVPRYGTYSAVVERQQPRARELLVHLLRRRQGRDGIRDAADV
jgi:hypothetical protein